MTMNRGRIRVEEGHKRVRVYLGGELIADSTHVTLVWENPHFPVYYFPEQDVRVELLTATGRTQKSPSRGIAHYFDVKSARKVAEHAAYRYPDSPVEELRPLIAFDWNAMDNWFEENEEVFVHARDPYTRVDILAGSRHVQVVIDGVEVANSHRPTLVFETGLPVRYYLPKTDVRMDLLTPTSTHTACPYKGTADYWSVTIDGRVHEDIVWGYRLPAPESVKLAGLVSFYNEKVDVYVDGELQPRPKTAFS
jgi:uncharacterized protein (DUF427 family)